MCYIIEFIDDFKPNQKVKIIVKRNSSVNVKDLDVWLTAKYDFLGVVHTYWQENIPFKINIPFGTIKVPKIITKEDVQKPYKCKISDPNFVSIQQCIINTFTSNDFSYCPQKVKRHFKCFHISSLLKSCKLC